MREERSSRQEERRDILSCSDQVGAGVLAGGVVGCVFMWQRVQQVIFVLAGEKEKPHRAASRDNRQRHREGEQQSRYQQCLIVVAAPSTDWPMVIPLARY